MTRHLTFTADGMTVGWCDCWVGEAHTVPAPADAKMTPAPQCRA